HEAHSIEIASTQATAQWSVATGLDPIAVDKRGFGLYGAANFEELVDSPFELGCFWTGRFMAAGVPHRFVVAGAAPSFDSKRLLADAPRICETAIAFWHGGARPPFRSYVFMLNAVGDGYGGLEHRNSTALICGRRDLPRLGERRTSDGYTTLLGLISHEYFHTWNVKRLRPAEFASLDFGRENYTGLLWFFEGFTSYYDDLLLRRAGLIDDAAYLKLLTKTINQVLQTPGRKVQTVAQASFDAWVKYYRQDENTPNTTVSYYTKGALVALCLDMTLRSEGKTTLDDVMRGLWQRCPGGLMTEDHLRAVLREQGGRSFDAEIAQWAHSTAELALGDLLEKNGVRLKAETAQLAQRLGIRVQESHSIQIKTVLRGGAAEKAGMAAGDEWLAVECGGSAWRVSKLDDVAFYCGTAKAVTAMVARDGRILRLALDMPVARQTEAKTRKPPQAKPELPDTVSLSVADPAAVARWLGATAGP
ncbi:MAG: M61 family metallopeptidase, partial [Acidovorax sp.]